MKFTPSAVGNIPHDSAWLVERRRISSGTYNETPLPRRGLHLWRYTDPAKFGFEPRLVNPKSTPQGQDAIAEQEKLFADSSLAALVVDLAGQHVTVKLSEKAAASVIRVMPLTKALEHYPELVEKNLYALINDQFGKFESLNGAQWHEGVFVYVPKGVTLNEPVHVIHDSGSADGSIYSRTLIVVDENAEATIIDEYVGGEHANSNAAVEVLGLARSRTRYVAVQRQNGAMNGYLTHRAQIEQDATMVTIPLAFGGALVKQNFGVILNGKGADSKMTGLLFGTEHQHFDNHTLHHHAAGQTTSNIDFKVALKDKALSAYTGLIRIDRHAKTCAAYQENRNLLLNPGTKAETIPELEILNEDVTCTHGATVGPIDPLQLFYLQSRGMRYEDAVRMIIAGYVSSTFGLLPEDLRGRIETYVNARLERI